MSEWYYYQHLLHKWYHWSYFLWPTFTPVQFRVHWDFCAGGHSQDYYTEDALLQESMECVRLYHRYQFSCGYVKLSIYNNAQLVPKAGKGAAWGSNFWEFKQGDQYLRPHSSKSNNKVHNCNANEYWNWFHSNGIQCIEIGIRDLLLVDSKNISKSAKTLKYIMLQGVSYKYASPPSLCVQWYVHNNKLF